MTGVYGKLPAHGDFVRRELPQSFVQPWDQWLQAALGAAQEALGEGFDAFWRSAAPLRFRLTAGLCGPDPVAGVLLASEDAVGRRFPLTLAALLPDDGSAPNAGWYLAVEEAGRAGRDQADSVDALLATLPSVASGRSIAMFDEIPAAGWWTEDGPHRPLSTLPTAAQLRLLLQGGGGGAWLMAQGATHRGTVRSRNEDAFIERGDIGLWVVADGAGGHGAGDVASAAVTSAMADLPVGLSAAEILVQVRLRLGAVHGELQRIGATSTNGETPVTTVVALMARGEHFACLWAGDSRAYLLRGGELCQVTRDHSLVQELVDAGALAPEEAEDHPQVNVITRAVGSQEALALDKVSGRLQGGDVFLLCTDGLSKALPDAEIQRLLAEGGGPQALIDRALAAGARDNVTAVVVQV